jgi:hypothetical protein
LAVIDPPDSMDSIESARCRAPRRDPSRVGPSGHDSISAHTPGMATCSKTPLFPSVPHRASFRYRVVIKADLPSRCRDSRLRALFRVGFAALDRAGSTHETLSTR